MPTQLQATLRQSLGTADSRRQRHERLVPAVIYGPKTENIHCLFSHDEVIKHLRSGALKSDVLEIGIEKKTYKVTLKSLDMNPVKHVVMHMDLMVAS